MAVPDLLGVSPSTLGVALALAWVFVFGLSVYRFMSGSLARERLYTTAAVSGLWLAYSLLQIADSVEGTPEAVLVALAVGVFATGIIVGVHRLRIRNGNTDVQTQA